MNSPLSKTDPSDLIPFRAQMLGILGPAYVWLIMLSPVEWATLSTADQEMYTNMRIAWIGAYAHGSEIVLQHWQLLKDKPKNLAPSSKCSRTTWAPVAPVDDDAFYLFLQKQKLALKPYTLPPGTPLPQRVAAPTVNRVVSGLQEVGRTHGCPARG